MQFCPSSFHYHRFRSKYLSVALPCGYGSVQNSALLEYITRDTSYVVPHVSKGLRTTLRTSIRR